MKMFVISFAMLFEADNSLVSDVYKWQGKTLWFNTRAECEASLLQLGNSKIAQGNEVNFKTIEGELTLERYGGEMIKDVRSYYECSELNIE